MKIKSIVSSFLAVAIAMTATTALTSIDASAEDYGTAWVMFTGTDERTEKDKGSSQKTALTQQQPLLLLLKNFSFLFSRQT